MRPWAVPALLLLLALAPALAAEPAPRARKLDTDEPPGAAGPATDAPRALPRTAAVCRDRGARRCWVAAREADCRPAGEIFRTVIADPGDDVATALGQCRAEMSREVN